MISYKYDIAISLCKQDVEFARKLVKALNPGLKVFFYEDRQEELVGESGPQAFAKRFKEESRIVVILSRNEWGSSYYTELEKNAILDRTSAIGYNFLLVIPIEPGQAPVWYPATRIYIDPRRFEIDQLAKFIEFKVTEEGGVVNPLTSEEYANHFINQLKEKKGLIELQHSAEAIEVFKSEVLKLKNLFNLKIEYFANNSYHFSIAQKQFIYCTNDSYFGLGNLLLNIEIRNMDWGCTIVTTQQASLWMRLISFDSQMQHSEIKSTQYKFYYSEKLKGWAIPIEYSGSNTIHINHLFSEFDHKWYDLKNPISTEELVNNWFKELWRLVNRSFKDIL